MAAKKVVHLYDAHFLTLFWSVLKKLCTIPFSWLTEKKLFTTTTTGLIHHLFQPIKSQDYTRFLKNACSKRGFRVLQATKWYQRQDHWFTSHTLNDWLGSHYKFTLITVICRSVLPLRVSWLDWNRHEDEISRIFALCPTLPPGSMDSLYHETHVRLLCLETIEKPPWLFVNKMSIEKKMPNDILISKDHFNRSTDGKSGFTRVQSQTEITTTK